MPFPTTGDNPRIDGKVFTNAERLVAFGQ